MSAPLNLDSKRAREARLGARIGATGYRLLIVFAGLSLATAVTLCVLGMKKLGFPLASLGLALILPALWWKRHLSVLPVHGDTFTDHLSYEALSLLQPSTEQTPHGIWLALQHHWHSNFLANHLLLNKQLIVEALRADSNDLDEALQIAADLATKSGSRNIEPIHLSAGLLMQSQSIGRQLVNMKSQPQDIEEVALWLAHDLAENHKAKQNFGGIGRDWAFGYTPLLDRMGQNISQAIMKHNARFGSATDSEGVRAVEAVFNNRASAVALIGPDGIGKSTTVYALARRLIEGNTGEALAYHQVVSINATDVTSNARAPRDLEDIMIRITNEASYAGHILLFFDDAQLFFSDGAGAFDASHILLSIIQSRAVPIILALSPSDFQRLRGQNPSLASLLTPVILQEPSEATVMRSLEDSAVTFENRSKVLIAYEALHEAYRLSGRYEQDEAYPGKAIKLLEQSVSHANSSVVSALSVQQAVEQTRGIKVSSAAPQEADALLHLEDMIHQRMINQSHAVSVVANALRRARAGVTNPRRPIGSFLFLGPTGVGKTELAKAIAATYFGAESSMIRLDMSEYQQPDDVQRLLSAGENDASLLLAVRRQPFSVVLLDEIEKAHPNVLNLLLQMLDEGQLTDSSGRAASFKDCVIIATSNAGSQTIRERVSQGASLDSFAGELSDQLITSGQFKPELLNRFDEMVLFRPLTVDELAQVVKLMLQEVNVTLTNQNISVELTDAAIASIVEQGNDPRLGARPMRRALQRAVEDTIAQKILRGETRPGDHVVLDAPDLPT
ncbi:MAG: AAA family ATPase [Patescibacteria group bacterium]|nr:AAA family ATPase [Patescibacteria group bacterium]